MTGKLVRAATSILVLAGGLYAGGVASAATVHRQSASRTFIVRSQTTQTDILGFPFALKYGNAQYSGKVRILPPARGGRGQARPRLSLVKVLSRGPAEGGSVYRVKVRNNNPRPAAPVRMRVTTTTMWSS
jgi:hypothetical protein